MSILVTGYPGNVASPLVAELLRRGADLRAAVRDPERRDVDPGVATVRFDFTDPSTFGDAFKGVDTLFLLRPPQLSDVARDIAPALEAARTAGVRHVVFLSIQGAERNRVVPHHAIEQWLRGSGLTWTFVRAAYFFQNLLTTHGPELARGEIFVPAGRARTSLVDARDVAAVVAEALLDPAAHAGKAWTVTGPAALTYDECAEILTREWGRPIRYARPGVVRYGRALAARGVPRGMIGVTIGIYTAARLRLATGVTDDVRAVTGRPPRDFRTFARDTAGQAPTPADDPTPAVVRRKPPLALVRIANPVMRRVLASPLHGAVSGALLLLHVKGRTTGRPYDIVVGHHDLDGQLALLTNSPWRVNLRGGADVEVTLRGERRPMRAELDEDPGSVAAVYHGLIERMGWEPAQRRLGIAIPVRRTPTVAELEDAVRTSGLSIVRLHPRA